MRKQKRQVNSLTEWFGITDAPNWSVASPLGPFLSVIVALLFSLALLAAFMVIGRTVFLRGEATLGAGALIAAMLSAPFVIWGTVLKHQTVMFQKEGHMTDRINKAVEQLGTEKKVDRIGRPVALSKGNQDELTLGEKLDARTLIEWQGTTLLPEDGWHIVKTGDWEVFSESIPNIEVRIGAILSLERIAQDSTRHDKGRDHVRVMEILCAYIRENAPIRTEDAEKRSSLLRALNVNYANSDFPDMDMRVVQHWIANSPKPRSDVELALNVVGRRSAKQIEIEKSHPSPNGHYVLDLSFTDLRRVLAVGRNFSGANLRGSWFDGAVLNGAKFDNTNLLETRFWEVSAVESSFLGSNLGGDFTHAILDRSRFEFFETDDKTFISKAYHGRYAVFELAQLLDAHLTFTGNPTLNRRWAIKADFKHARMRGCLFSGFNQFYEHKWPEAFHMKVHEKGVAFRNCELTEDVQSRCGLENCFGDGSVLLADGRGPEDEGWPESWPRKKLSDHEYLEQLTVWRNLGE